MCGVLTSIVALHLHTYLRADFFLLCLRRYRATSTMTSTATATAQKIAAMEILSVVFLDVSDFDRGSELLSLPQLTLTSMEVATSPVYVKS